MDCRTAILLLGDYLEATLDAEALASLEAHLEDCPPCQAYLATYRRAAQLAATTQRQDAPPEMPAEMRRRLLAFLRDELTRPTAPADDPSARPRIARGAEPTKEEL